MAQRLLCVLSLCAGAVAAQQQPPVWKWDLPRIQETVNKVRAGRDLTPKPWPNNAKVAVALSFDMDADRRSIRRSRFRAESMVREWACRGSSRWRKNTRSR